jgi:glyoxylase-like metal-dependent hydrolase (beta-lactamase superfamily II)
MPYTQITKNIFQIGGGNLSGSGDAGVFLVHTKNDSLVLIDSGMDSCDILLKNIGDLGFVTTKVIGLILTHAHIDHTGSAADLKSIYPKMKIYAHDWDREAIEGKPGTERITAASWYGIEYKPVPVDVVINDKKEQHLIGETKFLFLHTPGHTPGSISVIVEDEQKKILFGQDIHGPFMKEFNSNINDWANSMKFLISLKADILCEGHFGIYEPAAKVEKYIKSQLRQNNKE